VVAAAVPVAVAMLVVAAAVPFAAVIPGGGAAEWLEVLARPASLEVEQVGLVVNLQRDLGQRVHCGATMMTAEQQETVLEVGSNARGRAATITPISG